MPAEQRVATLWVLLGKGDPARAAILDILRRTPGIRTHAREWPMRDEDGKPDALLLRPVVGEAVSALKHRLGDAKAILLAGDEVSRNDARGLVAQGADAVLLDHEAPTKLVPAIQAALSGLVAVSDTLGPAVERPSLTPREKQVLALVVMGFSNKEIADQLVVAENTVKSHLFSAFRRLGVRSRSEAVALITDPARGLGSGILTIASE